MNETGSVQSPDQPSWGLLTFAGILMIILGAVAILIPAIASWFITVFIGWILIIGSLFIFGSAFGFREIGRILLRILVAVITLIAGLYLVINPGDGTETLTLILVIYFIVAGLFRIGAGISERGNDGAGWLVVNGVLSLLIGLLVGIDFPSSADWAIGLLVGIDLIFSGWVVIMLASVGKREARAA